MKPDEIPTPRPWIVYNDRGWLLCLMCAMERDGYYRGIHTKKKTRRQIRRWVMCHLRCGFEGLR